MAEKTWAREDVDGETFETGIEVVSNLKHYKTEPNRWYQALPYTFEFTQRDGLFWRLNLPINPSNLTITTHYATNVITTLYGTVEEHSEQRYFDIMIEGTTGMVPKHNTFVRPQSANNVDKLEKKPEDDRGSSGRTSTAIGEVSSSLNGYFQGAFGTLNQTLENIDSSLTNNRRRDTGLFTDQSGYVAFHRLYKLFLEYKREAAGEIKNENGEVDNGKRDFHPLIFKNYKDNNQYYVVPTRFQMVRSADSPMLYKYSIGLRAYGLQGLKDNLNFDELAVRYNDLGLDGVKNNSYFNDATSVVSAGVAAIGGVSAAAGLLGF